MAYAEKTTVSVAKSKVEIEELLMKHGADQMLSGMTKDKIMIGFSMYNRQVRIVMTIPKADTEKQSEQIQRQRWRALLLVIKARFEAIESGISTFEEEFLANIVLPDGSSVGQFMQPQIEAAYSTGRMPAMLPEL